MLCMDQTRCMPHVTLQHLLQHSNSCMCDQQDGKAHAKALQYLIKRICLSCRWFHLLALPGLMIEISPREQMQGLSALECVLELAMGDDCSPWT